MLLRRSFFVTRRGDGRDHRRPLLGGGSRPDGRAARRRVRARARRALPPPARGRRLPQRSEGRERARARPHGGAEFVLLDLERVQIGRTVSRRRRRRRTWCSSSARSGRARRRRPTRLRLLRAYLGAAATAAERAAPGSTRSPRRAARKDRRRRRRRRCRRAPSVACAVVCQDEAAHIGAVPRERRLVRRGRRRRRRARATPRSTIARPLAARVVAQPLAWLSRAEAGRARGDDAAMGAEPRRGRARDARAGDRDPRRAGAVSATTSTGSPIPRLVAVPRALVVPRRLVAAARGPPRASRPRRVGRRRSARSPRGAAATGAASARARSCTTRTPTWPTTCAASRQLTAVAAARGAAGPPRRARRGSRGEPAWRFVRADVLKRRLPRGPSRALRRRDRRVLRLPALGARVGPRTARVLDGVGDACERRVVDRQLERAATRSSAASQSLADDARARVRGDRGRQRVERRQRGAPPRRAFPWLTRRRRRDATSASRAARTWVRTRARRRSSCS